jgi:hypothetical protein
MTISKRCGIVLLVGAIGYFGLELGERLSVPGIHSFVSSAQAIVGRPLTPVSVAGVARRTARRCAAGVYYC